MKRLLFVSDYVEGLPVIASVRYEQLMRRISRRLEVCVASSRLYGESTVFAREHLLYRAAASRYTNDFGRSLARMPSRRGMLEEMLRGSGLVKKSWKRYQKSQLAFGFRNRDFFAKLRRSMEENPPDAVFVTVPELEALYVALRIKGMFPQIPLLCEMRDILDSDIWRDRPKAVVRRAERELMSCADGVIALSSGIARHYIPMMREGVPIEIIRNGYDETEFEGVSCESPICPGAGNRARLKLVHIGSIYEGRNIGDLLRGLSIFSGNSGVEVSLDLVGHVDGRGLSDIESFRKECNKGVEVRLLGSVSHKEALEQLEGADAAVIITHRSGSEYALPGKLFEYIGACKPVLAVSTDNELVLMVDGKLGECAGHSPQEVANAAKRLMEGCYDFSGREAYSRSIQAQGIIGFIERVVEGSRV